MQVVNAYRILRTRWVWILYFLIIIVPFRVSATHIIGGDVTMRAIGGTPGLFRVQLNQYWDQANSTSGNQDRSVRLLIYRKQNPVLIESLTLDLQEVLPLVFDNEACARLQKLSFLEARYYKTYQFDVNKYTDPGGYYMVWERCCRNDVLTNTISSTQNGLGMVFYMEFPPMRQSNTPFINSSPNFGIPNGDYICLNRPFTFNTGATDADGDELRYSLVTPLNGYTTRQTTESLNDSPKASYPTIAWAPGISLQNIIPGNPPLSINPTTGQLSVRATQEGLFLFTVQCEEFRNGQRIGVIRRDFQLPVIDCSKNTPPPAVIMVNNKPAQDISWCSAQPLVLTVEKTPQWAYQWQRDGQNLRGDTTSTLQVRETGVYTVVRSQAKTCGNDTVSQALRVTLAKPASVSLSALGKAPYCVGDTVTLQANGQPGYQYQWRRDGRELPGQQQPTLRINQSGQYKVVARASDAACEGADSLTITLNPRPTLSGRTAYLIARGDTVRLQTQASDPISRYQWTPPTALSRTDIASPLASPAETTPYQLTAVSESGCAATFAVLVEVIESIYIPSAFSPNADGMNDSWVIQNISSFPQCEVTIYNRWGELVFYSRGYQQPWDGTHQQELVRAGVYTYQIRTGAGTKANTYRGQLTIVR
ncbi:gliding motility-associated C-terminal domain-containing protein [Spirosoma fluminis]